MRRPGDKTPSSPEARLLLERYAKMLDKAKLSTIYAHETLKDAQEVLERTEAAEAAVEASVVKLYTQTNLSLREISEVLNLDESTIWRRVQQLNTK
jgi:transcriptional regulator of acetoin/glycerol metabolism